MTVQSVKYVDEANSAFEAVIDGETNFVQVDSNNYIVNQIANWIAAGNTPDPYVPLPYKVDQERDARIVGGFMFGGKLFQSRPDDQQNISGAGALALVAIVNGAQRGDLRWHGGASDFVWIATDNSLMPMDAQTVIAFGQAAASWKMAHVFAGRALKDAGVPVDYKNNSYWPA